ncbi:deubiquitinase OTUD6B [Nymphalis io]|uniref:deubiquitinase OTUD6B n=1 Tax=Inachis io TaxID=171585 RepID=UPI002169F5C1|nr:deubiquitinase OTUD6B [Nymphalis io]
MADNNEEDETLKLDQKHKKEKKELQAQIQALKKAAKNDKTKKKELNAEITKLESDLEERHKKEIETNANCLNPEIGPDEQVIESDNVKPKISKAQKRRDKKLQQERDREKEIKMQEIENINGPRNMENQAICKRLEERNLKICPIPSDGDCLYKAVVHQYEINYNKTLGVDDLRNRVSSYILEHKEDFMPFLSNTDTNEMLTDREFEEYCDKIKNTKVWGGQLEIRAISNCLKCPLIVIQASGPEAIEQGTEFPGPPLTISYHRHMYSLGEHYNSTQLVKKDDTKSEA